MSFLVRPRPPAPLRERWRFDSRGLGAEIAAALGAVAAAVLLGEALSELLKLPNLSMVFLTAVLFCGVRFGTRAAVLASLASFAAYNFFFIEPIYTFTVAQPQELFALLIFMCVAVLTGSLAGRLRDQREQATRNASATRSLYDYSRKLSGASSADDILWAAASHLHALFRGRVVVLVAGGARPGAARGMAARRAARSGGVQRRALGAGEARAIGLGDGHAAQRRVPVPPDGRRAWRHRGLRPRAAGARPAYSAGRRAGADRRCSTRPPSRSTGRCSPATR